MNNTAVVKQKTQFELAITDQSWSEYLQKFLGNNKNRFINNMISIVNNDVNMQNVDPKELINAGLQATTLNLPLNKSLGRAYVIAYKGHAQFQVGYKGLIEVVVRTGNYKYVNVTEIYDESELENTDFLNGKAAALVKVEKRRKEKGLTNIIGYCAKFVMNNGFEKELYMTKQQVEAHGKKYSQAYNYIWAKEFDKMACKTVLKLLISKYGITDDSKIQAIIASDQAVINDFAKQDYNYIDNPQNTDTVDAVATVVESKPEAQPKQINPEMQKAIDKLKKLFDSGVFNDEEKAIIRSNWKTNWKQAISDAEEAYKLKTTPQEEPEQPQSASNDEPPF